MRERVRDLLSLPFDNMETYVEAELAYKARNSDPSSRPNYYRILQSWHVRRSDYLSGMIWTPSFAVQKQSADQTLRYLAGKIMYMHGRRLGEQLSQDPDDAKAGMADQAQSYLAAIHALAMISEENAWITFPALTGRDDRQVSCEVVPFGPCQVPPC